ncbi:MAG TPA: AAA family ATPase [Candidatus Saccharimonadales bacterium]|nr:AAA family ATPase [Candidatus Saccharimonadales bacterium]
MYKCTLVIVSGLPATGKTVLSKKLAQYAQLPLFSKDAVKEMLFDGVGHGDRAWGEKLNTPTYDILDYIVEQQLRSRGSLIVETPYDQDFRVEKYIEMQAKYGFTCVQVLCYADPEILLQRFIERIGSADRHPGHNDKAALEDFKASMKNAGKVTPLPLAGQVYQVDTTHFAQVNEEALFREVRSLVLASTADRLKRLMKLRSPKLFTRRTATH